jgi:hypothetical protein
MVISLHIAKTTFDDDIYGYINQDPTAPPSFLGLNEGQKALLLNNQNMIILKIVWLMDQVNVWLIDFLIGTRIKFRIRLALHFKHPVSQRKILRALT